MDYALLADILVVIHAAFCAFVLFGQVLVVLAWFSRLAQAAASVGEEPGYRLPVFGWIASWRWVRNPWFRSIHLACILIVATEAFFKYQCPLTTWENDLREMAGERVSGESFVGRIMNEILFNEDYDPDIIHQIHMAFGGLVLLTFLFFPPRLRRRPAVALADSKPLVLVNGTAGITNGHAAAAPDPAVREPGPATITR